MRKRYCCLLLVLCFAFTLSTASAGGLKIDKEELKNLPTSYKIAGVRPIRQGPRECGPTSMAMVLNFWGVPITKDEIWEKVRSFYGQFTDCTDMKNYFLGHGFETKVLSTSKYTKLQYFLYKGYPLIAYTESRRYPGEGHVIVLIGYDEKGFNIIDPGPGKFDFLTYEQFQKLHSIFISDPLGKPVCGPYWTLALCPKEGSVKEKKISYEKPSPIIFVEHFDNNAKNWYEIDSDQATVKVDNGKYFFSHKRNYRYYLTWYPIMLYESDDFAIESHMKKQDGVNDHGYGIIWGAEDAKNYYAFEISGNGNYHYIKSIQGALITIIDWKSSSYINKGNSENKLYLKKQADSIQFFINDTLVDHAGFEKFIGNKIGFRVSNRQTIEFDSIIVKILQ